MEIIGKTVRQVLRGLQTSERGGDCLKSPASAQVNRSTMTCLKSFLIIPTMEHIQLIC